MKLRKKNIIYVGGTHFYINRLNPIHISYSIPNDKKNWIEIQLRIVDNITPPLEDEILYYYNEFRGKKISINELNYE